jgi:hypothetical protein
MKYASTLVADARLLMFSFIYLLFWQDLRRTLPPEIDCLDEATRIALAMQMEERNCIKAEIDLAARRSRHFTFSSHHQHLNAEKLQKKFEKVSKDASAAVANAVKKHNASHPRNNTNVQNPNPGGKFSFPLEMDGC